MNDLYVYRFVWKGEKVSSHYEYVANSQEEANQRVIAKGLDPYFNNCRWVSWALCDQETEHKEPSIDGLQAMLQEWDDEFDEFDEFDEKDDSWD